MPESQKPTIGRTVHYVLSDADLEGGKNAGEERPAVIVRTWPGNDTCVQLTVLLDGANERAADGSPFLVKSSADGSSGPVPGCWHWPERT